MIELGLKIWSTNDYYVSDAVRLYEEGWCQYIELYSVPKSFQTCFHIWEGIKHIPFIIHAPHSQSGLNFAKSDCKKQNLSYAREAIEFANLLSASYIIFHPGTDGDLNETIQQIQEIWDPRIVIENKPYWGVDGTILCNGYTPEQIQLVIQKAKTGFCLDIGHAICAANALKQEPFAFISEFMTLNPQMFHLCDGDFISLYDQHLHLGKGNFPLKKIIESFPKSCKLSLETPKDYQNKLSDFEDDVTYLQNCLKI